MYHSDIFTMVPIIPLWQCIFRSVKFPLWDYGGDLPVFVLIFWFRVPLNVDCPGYAASRMRKDLDSTCRVFSVIFTFQACSVSLPWHKSLESCWLLCEIVWRFYSLTNKVRHGWMGGGSLSHILDWCSDSLKSTSTNKKGSVDFLPVSTEIGTA